MIMTSENVGLAKNINKREIFRENTRVCKLALRAHGGLCYVRVALLLNGKFENKPRYCIKLPEILVFLLEIHNKS